MASSEPLARLARAASSKRRADERFRAALLEAVDARGYAQVARELGVTRQAVRQLAERARPRQEANGPRTI
jgi:DNA-directed RNA polymerase specialized sigma24 family protein